MKLLLFTRALAGAQPVRPDSAIASPSVTPVRSRRRDDARRLHCVWSRAADGRLVCHWQRDDDGIPLTALRRFPFPAIARFAAARTYP